MYRLSTAVEIGSSFATLPASGTKPVKEDIKTPPLSSVAQITAPSSAVGAPQLSGTEAKAIRRVVPMPRARFASHKEISTFSPLQEWEGYVTSLNDETFTANLIDKTRGKNLPEEQMDFGLSELSDDDLELVKVGAIFRWAIGYSKQHGTKRKVSEIVFRRLPAWSRRDLEKAEARVANIMSGVKWTNDLGTIWE